MFGNFFAEKYNRVLLTLVLVGGVVALSAYAYFTMKQALDWNMGMTTINVVGEGEVVATPDIAQFSFSVRTEGKTAEEAQAMAASTTNAIMAYLKASGVEEKDIKTEGYNMYPHYQYDSKPCAYGMYCPPSEPVQDGFEVSQMVTVKVRATDKAGELIAGVGNLGATDMSGLSFTIDDTNTLEDEARAMAIEDAKADAALLAEQLGVKLGEMVSYYEETNQPYYGYGMGGDMAMSAKAEAAPVPELAPGESTVTSRVNITYEIK